MNGIEMMLKSLGFDVEDFKKTMFGTAKAVSDGITALNQRQESIDRRLSRIEEHMGIEPLAEVNGHAVEIIPPEKTRARR